MKRSQVDIPEHPAWMDAIDDNAGARYSSHDDCRNFEIKVCPEAGACRRKDCRSLETPEGDCISHGIRLSGLRPLRKLQEYFLEIARHIRLTDDLHALPSHPPPLSSRENNVIQPQRYSAGYHGDRDRSLEDSLLFVAPADIHARR